MKYIPIVFSPTGGTEKVLDAFTKNLPTDKMIDLTKSDYNFSKVKFSSEDMAVIAMPSFGGLAPEIALKRLREIKGNGAKCILIAVYGNRAYEDTLVQMEDTAEASGFKVIAAISAVAEHSIMHQYATGRPNEKDQKQLEKFAEEINEKLEKKDLSKPLIPGNRPYKKAGSVGLVPKAGSSCDECGICIKVCPVQAIDSNNPKITDKKKCISCMRCISVCPKNARKVNKLMVSAAALAIKKACLEPKEAELFL